MQSGEKVIAADSGHQMHLQCKWFPQFKPIDPFQRHTWREKSQLSPTSVYRQWVPGLCMQYTCSETTPKVLLFTFPAHLTSKTMTKIQCQHSIQSAPLFQELMQTTWKVISILSPIHTSSNFPTAIPWYQCRFLKRTADSFIVKKGALQPLLKAAKVQKLDIRC